MTTQDGATAVSGTARIGNAARRMGLDTSLLYETVVDLADEGFLTAKSINTAAGILLNELGLPEYYFRNISQTALKRILQAIATNLTEDQERFVLSSETAHIRCSVEGDFQVLMATAATRDTMESLLGTAIVDRRWEYYFGAENGYHTYIIRPEKCKPLAELAAGENPFAFAQDRSQPSVPQETRHRYERFLAEYLESVSRLIQFSSSKKTGETRIMFHKTVWHAALPIVRQVLNDRGLTLDRAYRETYRARDGHVASVCSLYVDGILSEDAKRAVAADLRAFLALGHNEFADLYLNGVLGFREMQFAVVTSFLLHQMIYKELPTDREIMASLTRKELRDAMAQRISDANRSEYSRMVINEAMRENPDLIKHIYVLFENRFNPERQRRPSAKTIAKRVEKFQTTLVSRFMEDTTSLDIFRYLCLVVTEVLKTNFYKVEKRSFAFRLTSRMLDPTVFADKVYGLFFVFGHFALGTHMRAEAIARGGLRLLRTTPGNYENQLDDATLLNYALGPQAQRLKHKDIAESGSKGVIVPEPVHARDTLNAIHDYSEGIMDLILPSPEVIDYLGEQEMLFFGPDEGTAHVMDKVSERARERGHPHWRTFTTGKTIGLPHDAFGITLGGQAFALFASERQDQGTELVIDGRRIVRTKDAGKIYSHIGTDIATSGMTTTGVMASFRTLAKRRERREEELNLMLTGGPDGDLGANQIQTYRGRICLIIDGGAVLFDPDGLDREALMLLALNRHEHPRLNAAAFPRDRLGPKGFLIERSGKNLPLPDGTVVEDGALFHRNFLTAPDSRRFTAEANIRAFVPCGGFKDTINFANVRTFLENFAELEFIVEGANVFFDNTSREVIAAESAILQIKDSTANKGGVTSSSLGEVLTAFLLGDDYEKYLVDDAKTRFRLARELLDIITANAAAETGMLLDLHDTDPETPLFRLSIDTSERLLAFQAELAAQLDAIRRDRELVLATLVAYVPPVLVEILGREGILATLNREELTAYRDTILTKKLAALALYRHATDWDAFQARFKESGVRALSALVPSPRPR